MNNKGFTLIELLGVIVILALITGITSYAIVGVTNNIKNENYTLLVEEIKKSCEVYYQECNYGGKCPIGEYKDTITLKELVKYGYLSSNENSDVDKSGAVGNTIINPKNNEDIGDCVVKISYSNGELSFKNNSSNDCPSYGE